MRNKEFIPYEQALALQQLGFNEECFGTWFELEGKYSVIIRNNLYGNDLQTPSPLYQQAFRWFREKHNLIGLVESGYENGKNIFTYVIWNKFIDNVNDDYYSTYEEAELDCLKKLIEIVKNK